MRYPVYIVSKGRADTPLTARCFERDGVDYKIAVEPQEADAYRKALGNHRVLVLPFSNLGVGSYPARQHVWDVSRREGHKRHWVFDDNIMQFRRLHKGKRIPVNAGRAISILEEFIDRYTNVAIGGFNYTMFAYTHSTSPYRVNAHLYSAMCIRNDLNAEWRMKYNEDVDLCLQVLTQGLCTVQFNAFCVDKISTLAGMKGGNQTELYKNNDPRKAWIKTQALKNVWGEYVTVKHKFSRWHHEIAWNKHFKQPLIRRADLDWKAIAEKQHTFNLSEQKPIKHRSIRKFKEEYNGQ